MDKQYLKGVLVKCAVPITAVMSYAGYVAATTCDTSNITCQLQPVLDIISFLTPLIAAIYPVIIQLVILGAIVGMIVAVVSIVFAIVGLVAAITVIVARMGSSFRHK